MITPVAIETIGWRYYILYLVISACIIPVVFLFYPETMGRSLEELEMMFVETKSILGVVRESKKPMTGGFLSDQAMAKNEKTIEEEEYAA